MLNKTSMLQDQMNFNWLQYLRDAQMISKKKEDAGNRF